MHTNREEKHPDELVHCLRWLRDNVWVEQQLSQRDKHKLRGLIEVRMRELIAVLSRLPLLTGLHPTSRSLVRR